MLATDNGVVTQPPSTKDWNSTLVFKMNPMMVGKGWNAAQGYDHWNYAAGMAKTSNYSSYCNTTYCNFAIGGPSFEMYLDAYNLYMGTNKVPTWGGSTSKTTFVNGYYLNNSGLSESAGTMFLPGSLSGYYSSAFFLCSGHSFSSTRDANSMIDDVAAVNYLKNRNIEIIDIGKIGSVKYGIIRPLVQLKNSVRINGGSGTRADPYKIIIP